MKELGDKVGVSESAIGMYETGKRKPDYEMLLKLSEVLDCSVDDLLNGIKKESDTATYSVGLLKEETELLTAFRQMSDEKQKMILEMAKVVLGSHE